TPTSLRTTDFESAASAVPPRPPHPRRDYTGLRRPVNGPQRSSAMAAADPNTTKDGDLMPEQPVSRSKRTRRINQLDGRFVTHGRTNSGSNEQRNRPGRQGAKTTATLLR